MPNTDIVKGYEFEKGRYVVIEEEDIEKVRVDSTRVINLEKSPTTRQSIRSTSSAPTTWRRTVRSRARRSR